MFQCDAVIVIVTGILGLVTRGNCDNVVTISLGRTSIGHIIEIGNFLILIQQAFS